MAALRPPPSFAAPRYYAIHAFRWLDADGGERYVRYTWKPTTEIPKISGSEAKARGPHYLREELAKRLAQGPVRFDLEVQIAGTDNDHNDPAAVWPSDRERVTVGTAGTTDELLAEGRAERV